jgi:hypothetical protein
MEMIPRVRLLYFISLTECIMPVTGLPFKISAALWPVLRKAAMSRLNLGQ